MLRNKSALVIFLIITSIAAFGCAISFTTSPTLTASPLESVTSTVSQSTPTEFASATSPVIIETPTTLPQATESTSSTNTTQSIIVTSGNPSGPYAVILVPAGDVLNIRSAAGVGNPVSGSFSRSFTNVMRTGPSARVGDSVWVQIQNPGGGTGWVNADFLTEHVSSSAICQNPQVTSLLNNLRSAVLNSNGESLASLVSPKHGFDLRFWRYGTLVNYDHEHARFLFDSTFQVNWGPAPGSGENTVGSFNSVVLTKLVEVFGANYEMRCNDTMDLATFSLVPWPEEYNNINFFAVHKPGSEIYGGLDWRTWLVGIEFVDGKPYLFSMIHFQWEP